MYVTIASSCRVYAKVFNIERLGRTALGALTLAPKAHLLLIPSWYELTLNME